jgi:ParB family chromosome partitioning protein
MAGLQEIPAIIKDLDSGAVAEVALIENLQREDLNPLEEAEAYRALVEEYGLTQEEIARRVGKSRPVIANALRLLQLPGEVQAMLRDNEITAGHARAILSLKGQEEQLQLARLIQEKQLTVREAEELVQKELSTRQKLVKSGKQNWEWQELEERLQQVFTTRVRIKTGKKGSRIEIYYFSDEDLERILAALLKEDVSRETY